MIGKEKETQCARLISHGVPYRLVADVLDISLDTVSEIATGVKRRREPRRKRRQREFRPQLGRCKNCGATNVEIMPSGKCRVCEIRLTITPKRGN